MTYSAHPIGCAAIVATLKEYKDRNVEENVAKVGKVLADILDGYADAHKCVGQVRHIGLFSAIELVKDKETREPLVPFGKDPEGLMKKILKMLVGDGFWTYSNENNLIVAPPHHHGRRAGRGNENYGQGSGCS